MAVLNYKLAIQGIKEHMECETVNEVTAKEGWGDDLALCLHAIREKHGEDIAIVSMYLFAMGLEELEVHSESILAGVLCAIFAAGVERGYDLAAEAE